MPARDIYHDAVRHALEKDGWTITDDPLRLEWGEQNVFVDLGAEQILAAAKAEQKIAVEVKSFRSLSAMKDLEQAIGQLVIYRAILAHIEPERVLYLAVPQDIVHSVFQKPIGRLVTSEAGVRVIGFDPGDERVLTWIT